MNQIPSLIDYKDLFLKAKYDFKQLSESNDIFDFVDCLLTLNALPEWISKSNEAPKELKTLADEKIKIMKGERYGFHLEEDKIGNSIDHQLRFIRLFCNHTKHKDNKNIPIIIKEFGGTIPATIPFELTTIIKIGDLKFNAKHIISNVLDFWDKNINRK
jgi:hypothetical protein